MPGPGLKFMTLPELQQLIRDTFGAKDGRRGAAGTFMWFMEEVGELSAGLRGNQSKDVIAAEFADVLAWLATLANIAGVDLEEAVRAKYGAGCPECHRIPCACGAGQKP
jgi:NTP pyrophosphatase (non-canonical NTP hydrolase)